MDLPDVDNKNYTVNHVVQVMSHYDISSSIEHIPNEYSKEKVEEAKKLVLAALADEKMDEYPPKLVLAFNSTSKNVDIIAIHATVPDPKKKYGTYPSEAEGSYSTKRRPNERSYYIQHGKIIAVK